MKTFRGKTKKERTFLNIILFILGVFFGVLERYASIDALSLITAGMFVCIIIFGIYRFLVGDDFFNYVVTVDDTSATLNKLRYGRLSNHLIYKEPLAAISEVSIDTTEKFPKIIFYLKNGDLRSWELQDWDVPSVSELINYIESKLC